MNFNGGFLKIRSASHASRGHLVIQCLSVISLLFMGETARSAPPTGPAPVVTSADVMFSTPDCQLPVMVDPGSLPSARQQNAAVSNASTSMASVALSSVLEAGARLAGANVPPSLTGLNQTVSADGTCPKGGEDVDKLLSGVKFEGDACPAPSAVDSLKNNLSNFARAQACEIARMEAGMQEIQMLNKDASELQKKVTQYQQCFQNSLGQVEKQVGEIADDIKDREEQLKNIDEKFQDKPGKPGLLTAQKNLDELYKSMNTQNLEMFEAIKQNKLSRKNYEEQKPYRTGALAMDCFNRMSGSVKRCEANGEAVNDMAQYAACRAQQMYRTIPGQQGQTTQASKVGAAKELSNTIRTAFNAISTRAPVLAGVPRNQDEAAKTAALNADQQSSSVGLITTVIDFDLELKSKLGSSELLKDPDAARILGLIKNEMHKKYEACSKNAENVVKREADKAEESFQKSERMVSTKMDDVRKVYEKNFSDAMRAVSGGTVEQVKVASCSSNDPDRQQGCLESWKKQLEEMRAGNSSALSNKPMMIRGTKGSDTQIPIACTSIQNCIDQLNSTRTKVGDHKKKVEAHKVVIVRKANANVKQFSGLLAGRLNVYSGDLRTRLERLSHAPGFSSATYKGFENKQQPTKEGELTAMPDNLVAFIGGQMNPPMPDVAGSDFSKVTAEVETKKNEKSAKLGQAMNELQMVDAKMMTCKQGTMKKTLETFDKDKSEFIAQCGDVDANCGLSDDALPALERAMSAIAGASGPMAEVTGSLSTGISGSCTDSGLPTGETEGSLKTALDSAELAAKTAKSSFDAAKRKKSEADKSKAAADLTSNSGQKTTAANEAIDAASELASADEEKKTKDKEFSEAAAAHKTKKSDNEKSAKEKKTKISKCKSLYHGLLGKADKIGKQVGADTSAGSTE